MYMYMYMYRGEGFVHVCAAREFKGHKAILAGTTSAIENKMMISACTLHKNGDLFIHQCCCLCDDGTGVHELSKVICLA